MPIKIPRLVRDSKTGIFYFRYTLPRHLAAQINQTSIYTSLRTRNNKQARAMAAMLNYGIEMSKPIDLSKVRELLKINIAEGVFEADTEDEQERGLRILEQMASLRQNAAPKPSASPDRIRSAERSPQTAPPQKHTHLMAAIVPGYIKEIESSLKPATVYKHKQTLKLFIDQAGDKLIDSYTKEDLTAFKTQMLNAGRVAHTVNQCLSHIKSFFAFAAGNGYAEVKRNPVDDMFIKNAKNAIKKREMFYDDDLAVIFDWKNYQKLAIKPDYFWGPLICLYSGMRIEEATSLEIADIKEQDGIPFFRVLDAKTPAGNRPVPIHSKLIELGLLDFVKRVQSVPDRENERLFWYLIDGHNGTKKNLSRRFSEYLQKLGVKSDATCFHSLRHTTITRFAGLNVNNSTIYQLTGHAEKGKGNAHFDYLHMLPMPTLKAAIEALDFHERIDFSNFNHRRAFTVF
ncbi:hypothetical protein FAZ69_04490 [Trinickia terrae]|uniref:Site-specific integrase n=1 Tax=Trinickia terrae TaxID=2571161 RepID=A0A4U1IDZ7_9BURK|nr:site-specific integrase [Trinickia terrae]TKC91705.1 hypothetical protein FAZ69_04490 [Trinickia terrae]